jgi:hypothetical protein
LRLPTRRRRAVRIPTRRLGTSVPMLTRALHRCGLRSWQLEVASVGAIGLCIGLWIRAKTVDQDERGNAERRALFVGLWPAMLWLLGRGLAEHE